MKSVASGILSDIRFALRTLRKSPGFTLASVTSIALAISLSLSLFELFHALSFEAPAISNPSQVVAIYGQNKLQPFQSVSWPNYLDLRSRQTAFSNVAAYVRVKAALREGQSTVNAWGEMTSANYFATLGLQPALGRFYDASEESSSLPFAVIGYDLWQHSYGGSPTAIGATLWLNQRAFTILGVAPRQFAGVVLDWGGVPQFWVPSSQQSILLPGTANLLTMRAASIALLVARLRPQVSLPSARANLALIATQLGNSSGDPTYNFLLLPVSHARFWPTFRDGIQHQLQMLMLLALCVLVVACTNVAALLFARSALRRGEIALRSAVGATPIRLIRQLLTESLLLGLTGGLAGIGLAWASLHATEQLSRLFPIPLHVHLHLNLAVISVGLSVSLLSGLLFGLIPALLLTRANLRDSLAAAQRSVSSDRGQALWLRRAVIVQIAICCAVAFTTLLLGRSLWKQTTADRGIHPAEVLCADFTLPPGRYPRGTQNQFYRLLLSRIQSLPAVKSAALASDSLNAQLSIRTGPTPQSPQQQVAVPGIPVSSGYFQTLGIALLRGRTFTPDNSAMNPPTDAEVVVSQALAVKLWPGQDPLGRHLYLAQDTSAATVIGIAADVLRGTEQAPGPFLYTSIAQRPAPEVTVYLSSRMPAADAASAIETTFAQLDPGLILENIEPLGSRLADANAQAITLAALVAIFAAIALLLVFVGIYALESFEVASRRHSTAIRLALGDTRSGILSLFLRHALRLCAIGLLAGLPLAIFVSTFFREWFWKIAQTDGISIFSVIFLVACVTLSASLVPAFAAARTNPANLLRGE